MRSLNRLFMASAALTCVYTAPALAAGVTDPYPYPGYWIDVIGAGSTFPSVVYRQLLDCNYHPLGYEYYQYTSGPGPLTGPAPGIPAGETINQNCPSFPFGTAVDAALNYYYAPTGSANGKVALKANDNNRLIRDSICYDDDPPFCIGLKTTIPYTSSKIRTYPYPQASGYHFSGSEDVWNLQDQKDWITAGNPAKFGNLVQLPTLAGAVTIVLNGKDGTGVALTQNGAAVSGSSSAINFTRQALCGIFSGHITKWNNPILTAQNGGLAMGTGQITVVHRFDGSGTNFLLTNALQKQCRAVTGPNNESDSTVVSYAFPWGDQSMCPALPRGANRVNWPDQFGTVCGVANPAPAGSVFIWPNYPNTYERWGGQALVNTVVTTNGAIGYASPGFVRPALVTGPITANLQNEWDVSTNTSATPTFVAPTVAATSAAMASATPEFDSSTLGNPLAWSLQGAVPNPNQQGAYPIAGFTWLLMYQCYNGNNNISQQLKNFLYTLYAGGNYEAILNSNGFAAVPIVWMNNAIYPLLNDVNLAPGNISGSGANPSCAGKVGAS